MLPVARRRGAGPRVQRRQDSLLERSHPPMAYGSARAFAAAFRAIGLDAEPTPPSDHRTRELGARYTSGDECYPAKVTVGDFMKVLEQPGVDPARVALLHADGAGSVPLRAVRAVPAAGAGRRAAIAEVEILSPTSQNAYDGLGELAKPFVRTGWRALLCADLLQKLLLHASALTRNAAATRERGLRRVACRPVPHARRNARRARRATQGAARSRWCAAGDRFRKLGGSDGRDLPLIGIVGEIFCRLNTFSNENLVQCLEGYGAEAWVSDIVGVDLVHHFGALPEAEAGTAGSGRSRRSARGSGSACRSATSTS